MTQLQEIKIEIAKIEDIDGVLKLQELYLFANLSEEERKQGFVTTPFTIKQLTDIIMQEGLFIAKVDNKIIGYAFGGSWDYFSQWQIFNVMIERFPILKYNNFNITTLNSFQYGPICIDLKFRGTGLLNKLFEFMRINMAKKYPLSITFINKINMRSTKAHVNKLGWKIIDEFNYNNNQYLILAFDMKVSIIN